MSEQPYAVGCFVLVTMFGGLLWIGVPLFGAAGVAVLSALTVFAPGR